MIGRVADRAVQAFGGAGYNYTAAAGGAMIALGLGRAWQSALPPDRCARALSRN
jgi:hypothetical protein